MVPGNHVVVEACSSPVAPKHHEKDTNTHPGVSTIEPLSEAISPNFSCTAVTPQIRVTNVLKAICNVDGPADARASPNDTFTDDQPPYQETCSGDIFTSQCVVDEGDEASSSGNGDQVVTVVYFGHDRETRVPCDPLQPQPVGIVALFEGETLTITLKIPIPENFNGDLINQQKTSYKLIPYVSKINKLLNEVLCLNLIMRES